MPNEYQLPALWVGLGAKSGGEAEKPLASEPGRCECKIFEGLLCDLGQEDRINYRVKA